MGSGDIKNKINLNVDFISESAKKKLEKAGGTITLKQKIDVQVDSISVSAKKKIEKNGGEITIKKINN